MGIENIIIIAVIVLGAVVGIWINHRGAAKAQADTIKAVAQTKEALDTLHAKVDSLTADDPPK